MDSSNSRECLKEPTKELWDAWDALSEAVDAHLSGQTTLADRLFRNANTRPVWDWINPLWTRPFLSVVCRKPPNDTILLPKDQRDPQRDPTPSTKNAVLKRDGYCCRYCGAPVVDAKIRKIIVDLYPAAVPWHPQDVNRQHAAFQCFWLQYDHVVPHSHGGSSSEDNVVVSCGLCNFGKDGYTLKQLGLSDPRDREPRKTDLDGLERMRGAALPSVTVTPTVKPIRPPIIGSADTAQDEMTFFIAGAWMQGNYVYTPEIDGKARYFQLGASASATEGIRDEIKGCIITCSPKLFIQRRLDPDRFKILKPCD